MQASRETGGYRLVRELGRGGMGIVHEAEEVGSGRRVALKVLSPEIRYSEETYRRFEREARLAASVSHARCVFVYGAHELDGEPAIAMELMTGETLEDRIDAGAPIPLETALRWTLDVLEGLEAARAVGVIHRDVKPSNCFLTADGRVKVGDFGLARTLLRDVRLTQSGQFLGSPLYAAPEQVRGDEVDARADVYSVGATLYALLSGRPPFSGGGLGEIISSILTDAPRPLRSLRRDVPRGLARAVRRAMHKDPRRRFPDHAAFAAALRRFLPVEGETAGLGSRFVAGVLDVTLMQVVAAVIAFAMLTLPAASATPERTAATGIGILLLFFAGLLAYFPAFEAWRGATPGKRLMQLVVVAARDRVRRPVLAAVRGVAFLALTFVLVALVGALLPDALEREAGDPRPALAYLVALAALFSTARRANGWRGLHELLSATRVLTVRAPVGRAGEADVLRASPAAADGVPARIGEHRVDGVVGPVPGGVMLAATDERLERPVWVQLHDGEAPAATREGGDARARRLGSGTAGGRRYEVWEALDGAPLAAYAETDRPLPWPLVLAALRDLLAELDAGGPVAPEALWIDGAGRLRVLGAPLASAPPSPPAPLDLAASVCRTLLDGSDLPLRAEPVVDRLRGAAEPFDSLAGARAALDELARGPQTASPGMRRRALIVTAGWFVFGLLGAGVTLVAVSLRDDEAGGAVAVSGLWLCLLYGVPATLVATLLRDGLGMRIAGLGLRAADGRRASRARCAARSALTWAPAAALFALAGVAAPYLGRGVALSLALSGAAVQFFTIVTSWRTGRVAPQDRIAGTRFVPR